jgi:hypothetical protein
VLPALAGAILGMPGGIGLFAAVNKSGGPLPVPPAWWLIATLLGTVVAVAVITMVPAWFGTRRSRPRFSNPSSPDLRAFGLPSRRCRELRITGEGRALIA